MKVKLDYFVLTCLISFLCIAIIGCSHALLPIGGDTFTAGAYTSRGEGLIKENTEIQPDKITAATHSQRENQTLAEEQIKGSDTFQPPDMQESDFQATDINPDDQAEIQEEISPSEGYQEAESENGDAPLEEEVEENSPQEKLDAALQLCQEAQKQWEGGNPDSAMESLDSAYELLTSVDPDNDAGLLQQKDDIRFLISKRTVEIYASRQNKVNGTHREIPLATNEYVEREINSFLGGERENFLEAISRSGLYRPMIVKELSDAGLPIRLSWLPLIESYFKEKAFSRARALGLWQFIPSTGCKFGLKRDKWVDERMDPQKSTQAAIEYLRQLHQMFGDWTTVLAAYNCGEGTVMRVIRNQHINYLDNFWDLYARLPQETARYVPRFLAAIQIIEDPNRFGIDLKPALTPPEYETVTVKRQVPLKNLAEKLGIGEKALTDLNPELRYRITPNYEYQLKVPLNTGAQILACLDSIPETAPPEPEDKSIMRIKQKAKYALSKTKPKPASGVITVRLKRGDTLIKLARKYGTTVKAIAAANRIKSTNRLKIGQKLRIPLKPDKTFSQSSPSPAQKGKNGNASRYQVYLVKKGDYPGKIAKNHNLDLDEFLKLNKLTSKSTIRPGQRVLVKID